MGQIVCEICGSNDMIKKDGVFQCQNCGMKYSLEEIRSMLGGSGSSAAAAPAAPVRDEKREMVDKYLNYARISKQKEDWAEAERYYKLVEMEEPDNIEAIYFGSLAKVKLAFQSNNINQFDAAVNILLRAINMVGMRYDLDRAKEHDSMIAWIDLDIMTFRVYMNAKTLPYIKSMNNAVANVCNMIVERNPNMPGAKKVFFIQIAARHEKMSGNAYQYQKYQGLLKDELYERCKDGGVVRFTDSRHILFGRFNNVPISWNILEVSDESALLFCDTCLLKGPVNRNANADFENSELNAWLNDGFLNYAFTEQERSLIKAPRGNPASLIGEDNMQLYSPKSVARLHGSESPCWWWTKTQAGHGALVDYSPNGDRNLKGHAPNDARIGIRPTLWLTIPRQPADEE